MAGGIRIGVYVPSAVPEWAGSVLALPFHVPMICLIFRDWIGVGGRGAVAQRIVLARSDEAEEARKFVSSGIMPIIVVIVVGAISESRP